MSKPIVPWMGGKRRLAKHIIPLFPEHTTYVEPFAGGAAIFFMKDQVKTEVINDINGELVNLYRVIKHHLEEFLRYFKHALISRQQYEWEKMAIPATLTDIQRAARYYYLQKLAFGGKSRDQHFGTAATAPPKLNLLRIEEDLSMAHLRLSRVYVENLPWHKCIERYDRTHTLHYMDPPYWGTEGYGIDFDLDQYDRMAELMGTMKGKAVVSVNDIPKMRKAFKGFTIDRVEIPYTVGGSKKGQEKRGELIIRNY